MNAATMRTLMSSASEEWSTPLALWVGLHSVFRFTLDVCATAENAKCARYFTREQDGLAQEWTGVCWMNPPYGRQIGKWVAKARDSAAAGALVVCLLPSRTDTRWWHEHVEPVRRNEIPGAIKFLQGRLRFGGSKSGAPFSSVIVVFTPKSFEGA